MNKLFKETGVLSTDGEIAVLEFRNSLKLLLNNSDVSLMTEAQLRVLQSNLHKIVGDTLFDTIVNKK